MGKITVRTNVRSTLDMVWECWTLSNHIIHWNFASDDWCCPNAENDLKPGGHFSWRMEAKDGSMGFDFEGTFEQIKAREAISYSISDGRKVEISFTQDGDNVHVTETFDAEDMNSEELQRGGWQAILDNFKKYVESK